MPSNYRQQDPYSGQKSRGIAQINGGKGAATPSSAINAYQQSKGTADPFTAFGNLSAAWSGALAPNRTTTGVNPTASIPAYGTGGGRTASGFGANAQWQPMRSPGEGAPAPPGSTAPFSGQGSFAPFSAPPMVTYGGPNGTTTSNPNRSFASPIRDPWEPAPVPPGMTRVFGESGNSGFNPSGPPLPMAGGGVTGYNPFAQPIGDNMPYEEIRRKIQQPDNRYAAMSGGGSFMSEQPEVDRPFPSPYTPPPAPSAPRPPATPSTQPPPVRPPQTPSTQPVSGYQPIRDPWEGAPAPPGSTRPFGPSMGTPFQVPPMVTYGGPNGTTTNPTPWIPSGGAPSSGRTPTGMTTPPTRTAQNDRPFGSNGIGRRYKAPEQANTPSGQRNTTYGWFRKPDGATEKWETDSAGNPMRRVQTGQQPRPGDPITNWGSAAPSTPGGSTQTGTNTTTGTTAAPNNTTTFDPSVLPQSDAGKYLDPVFQDMMDKLTRQLRHEGSLTGATNSGGFIPGLTEKLAPVANQFAAQRGQLMFQDQQAKADRLLDKYKFDNTQQLEKWITENKNELERYGIDQNVLLGRYSADKSLQAAGLGANASTAAARIGADASRNNAWLDYMQGMAGIGANYGLGQDRLGFDYYNADQNYNLGQGQLGYNYWNSGQQRQYDDMFNRRGYDLGMTGINRDVYGMDQAQQRYLMDLMWRMSPGGQMGGGFFPSPGVFPYGG